MAGVAMASYESEINARVAVQSDLWFCASQQRHLEPRLYVIDLRPKPESEGEYFAIVANRGAGRSFVEVGTFDVKFLRSGP